MDEPTILSDQGLFDNLMGLLSGLLALLGLVALIVCTLAVVRYRKRKRRQAQQQARDAANAAAEQQEPEESAPVIPGTVGEDGSVWANVAEPDEAALPEPGDESSVEVASASTDHVIDPAIADSAQNAPTFDPLHPPRPKPPH